MAERLRREERARASHAALDLVGDDGHARRTARTTHPVDEVHRESGRIPPSPAIGSSSRAVTSSISVAAPAQSRRLVGIEKPHSRPVSFVQLAMFHVHWMAPSVLPWKAPRTAQKMRARAFEQRVLHRGSVVSVPVFVSSHHVIANPAAQGLGRWRAGPDRSLGNGTALFVEARARRRTRSGW
jgi:hypothetical protein